MRATEKCDFCGVSLPPLVNSCPDHNTAKECKRFTDRLGTDQISKVMQGMTDQVFERLDRAEDAERREKVLRLRVIRDNMDSAIRALTAANEHVMQALRDFEKGGSR